MRIVHILSPGENGPTGITEVVLHLSRHQRALGHEVHAVFISPCPFYRPDSSWSVVQGRTAFRRFVESFSPQLVVFHSLYKLPYIGWARYLRTRHIPYMVEMHGASSTDNQRKSRIRKRIANLLLFNNFLRESQAIIYLNEAERNNSVFLKLSRSVVIPNGVDLPDRFVIDKAPPAPVMVVYLGRIDMFQKGLDYLVEALTRVHSRLRGKAMVHFYGYACDDRFQELLRPLADIAVYHGAAFGEAKAEALRGGDLFVHTSRYEGMPMAIIEALSYGMPCLVTPQTNMADLILDGHAGWVTTLDAVAIGDTLLRAIDEYENATATFRRAAREAVVSYSWPLIAKRSVEVYKQVLDAGH